MKRIVWNGLKNNQGQSLVEMGLTISLLAIVRIGVLIVFGNNLGNVLSGDGSGNGGFFAQVNGGGGNNVGTSSCSPQQQLAGLC